MGLLLFWVAFALLALPCGFVLHVLDGGRFSLRALFILIGLEATAFAVVKLMIDISAHYS